MRVVIASRIFSPEPSAASFMLEAVARAFARAGHQVVVLTTTWPGAASQISIPGVTIHRAPVLRDRSGYVRGYLPYLSFDLPLAVRLLITRRADLYLVEPPPTTGAVVRVVTALLRRPYVYDAADIWSDAAALATSSQLVLRVLRQLELFALRGARHAVAISSHLVGRMRELGVDTPATVIGFGVDPAHFHYLPDEASSNTFVYAGSYSEWHGAGIFVEAFARFVADHAGWKLLYVGNGADRDALERRVAELRIPSVEFRDPVGASELNRILAGASASLASLKPGQGYDYAFTTKVYSSIAAGCPVIFAGVGPTIQFLTDANRHQATGTAVGYDIDAVVEAMEAAAAEPIAPANRHVLSEWARGLYSLESIADRVVEIATDAVQRR